MNTFIYVWNEEIDIERKIAWPYDYWMRKKDYNNKITTLNVKKDEEKEKTEEKHIHTHTNIT